MLKRLLGTEKTLSEKKNEFYELQNLYFNEVRSDQLKFKRLPREISQIRKRNEHEIEQLKKEHEFQITLLQAKIQKRKDQQAQYSDPKKLEENFTLQQKRMSELADSKSSKKSYKKSKSKTQQEVKADSLVSKITPEEPTLTFEFPKLIPLKQAHTPPQKDEHKEIESQIKNLRTAHLAHRDKFYNFVLAQKEPLDAEKHAAIQALQATHREKMQALQKELNSITIPSFSSTRNAYRFIMAEKAEAAVAEAEAKAKAEADAKASAAAGWGLGLSTLSSYLFGSAAATPATPSAAVTDSNQTKNADTGGLFQVVEVSKPAAPKM